MEKVRPVWPTLGSRTAKDQIRSYCLIASLHEKKTFLKQRVIGKMADTVGNGEFMCSGKHCNVHRRATENNKWIYVVRFCKNLKHAECANMRKRS